MKTFSVQTLGCKVNQYESEQLCALLRARGLVRTEPAAADLRIINTCSVTVQAASQSRQAARRLVRLPLLAASDERSRMARAVDASESTGRSVRVIVAGCWATGDYETASALPGVDAVITHRHDVAAELDRLLGQWQREEETTGPRRIHQEITCESASPEPLRDDRWIIKAGAAAGELTKGNRTDSTDFVNQNRAPAAEQLEAPLARTRGTGGLPLLGQHQESRQRAFLKIQDGCDAHCTYCIIPQLRSVVWSKPADDVVTEARALVDAGHQEIVLTGIFIGAYGQPTALRRRQAAPADGGLSGLIEMLCTRVPELHRLRISSLEPGDLTDELLQVMRSHEQVVPHLHLPLQSGSEKLLRRMNRQYTRDDFLRMLDRVRSAFDRPALTTDIIVGFPGETEDEYRQTLEVVDRAGFIHIHAFPFSPRPGTAAARWDRDFVRGPIVRERIDELQRLAAQHSLRFRSSFLGEVVELIVERNRDEPCETPAPRHGRCGRYFSVFFNGDHPSPGDRVQVRITQVTPARTEGVLLTVFLPII